MNAKQSVFVGVVSLLLLQTSGIARADLLVSSIPDEGSDGDFISADNQVAVQFTTGGNALMLSNVTLSMKDYFGFSSGTFSLTIYGQGGVDATYTYGKPTGLLETLSGNSAPETEGLYTYESSGLALAANTVYWVVAMHGSGGDGVYQWTETIDATPSVNQTTGASIQHYLSKDGSDDWDTAGDVFNTQSMSVEAIPEPTVICFILLFGGVTCGVRRFFFD